MSRVLLALLIVGGFACAQGGVVNRDGGGEPLTPADAEPPPPDSALPGECGENSDCDDGLVCTGTETCVGEMCEEGTLVDCDDDVSCTKDECTEPTGECIHAPENNRCLGGEYCHSTEGCLPLTECDVDADCDDGLYCNGAETCHETMGCQAGTAPACVDSYSCTMDSCNEATDACVYTAVSAMCSDGLACNGSETCNPSSPSAAASGCVTGAAVACNDGIACTTDSCTEPAGTCTAVGPDADGDTYIANTCGGTDCNDALAAVNHAATEACGDSVDNNCAGGIDEGCATATPPANDQCAGAISLSSIGTRADTLVAATQQASGCGSGIEVFYRVVVTQRSVVYLDTFGTSFDTRISYLGTSCPGTVANCEDDACGGYQSQLVQVVDSGTHYFAVHTYSSSTTPSDFDLRYAIVAGAAGDNAELTATGVYSGSTSGSNGVTATCGSSAASAEDSFYWTQCEGQTRTFSATTCVGSTAFDTVLHLRGNGTQLVCDDDFETVPTLSCSSTTRSYVTQSVSGVGLYQVFVDGYGTASSGAYSLEVVDF